MPMDTTTKVVLGLATLGVATAAVVYWPKKASAAQGTPGGSGGAPADKALPSTWPSWITSPPTWWTTPPALSVPKDVPKSWTPTSDWIPPWVKAETASKAPGVVGDEYKAGYNDGFKDAAYSSSWGTSQDKTKYAGSSSYKNGYDAGWAEYTSKVSTGAAYVGGHEYVRVGGRMIPADRIIRPPGSWSDPWREQIVRSTEPVRFQPGKPSANQIYRPNGSWDKPWEKQVRVGAPRPQPTGPLSSSQAAPTNYTRRTPMAQAAPTNYAHRTPASRPAAAQSYGPTAQQPPRQPMYMRVTGAGASVGTSMSTADAISKLNKYVVDMSPKHDLSLESWRAMWVARFGYDKSGGLALVNYGGIWTLLNDIDACAPSYLGGCDRATSEFFRNLNKDLGLATDNGWVSFDQMMRWLGHPVPAAAPPAPPGAPGGFMVAKRPAQRASSFVAQPMLLRVTGTVGAVAGGFAQGAWDTLRDISRVPHRMIFGER